MKCIIAFTLALVAMVCSEEFYAAENDKLDIQAVINNPEQRKAFVDCFTDKGGCNPALSDFKRDLSEAIQQACLKCSPAQKGILKQFLEGLKEKMPEGYVALKDKYDSENKYFGPLEAAIA